MIIHGMQMMRVPFRSIGDVQQTDGGVLAEGGFVPHGGLDARLFNNTDNPFPRGSRISWADCQGDRGT